MICHLLLYTIKSYQYMIIRKSNTAQCFSIYNISILYHFLMVKHENS